MTKARNGHRRPRPRAARRARHENDPNASHGVVVGWAMPDMLEEAKQQTHDTLIALMGPTRTGGVTWRFFEGAGALKMIEKFVAAERDLVMLLHYRQIERHLRARGGVMVMATAPGSRPDDGYRIG